MQTSFVFRFFINTFMFTYYFISTDWALAMSDDDKKCADETENTSWSYEKSGDASKVTYSWMFISLSGQGLTGGIRVKKKSDGIIILPNIYFS